MWIRRVSIDHRVEEILGYVSGQLSLVFLPIARGFLAAAYVGTGPWSTPDCTIRRECDEQGRRLERGDPSSPLFLVEVERSNGPWSDFIRHMGMLLVNHPRVTAVLGIQGSKRQDRMSIVLILLRRVADEGIKVEELFDFGPDPWTEEEIDSANATLSHPLTLVAAKPVVGVHGATVREPPRYWSRIPGGLNAETGEPWVLKIDPALVVGGAFNVEGQAIEIPPGDVKLDFETLHFHYGW